MRPRDRETYCLRYTSFARTAAIFSLLPVCFPVFLLILCAAKVKELVVRPQKCCFGKTVLCSYLPTRTYLHAIADQDPTYTINTKHRGESKIAGGVGIITHVYGGYIPVSLIERVDVSGTHLFLQMHPVGVSQHL